LPLESNIGEGSINDVFNYIVIYPVTEVLSHNGTGDYTEDGDNGVYHFLIGKNDGIIKTMKFAKTDIQYIREARFMNHGHDGLMQLSAVYKVTLEMFGNTIFYPGMYIFIDPRGVGGSSFDPTKGPSGNNPGSIANSLGLGGYHLITRVNSTVGPGQFDTTVEAQFVYSGDGKEGPFKRAHKKTQPKAIQNSVFAARSVNSACTKITLRRQSSLRPSPADSAVAGPQNIYNLAVAAKKGLLDGIIEGTYVGSNPLLTIEDADRIAANEAENKRRVAELANEEAAKALGVTYQVPLPPNINVPQQNQQAQNIAANAINKIKEAEEDDHHSAGGD
jgi:hypothetical protein